MNVLRYCGSKSKVALDLIGRFPGALNEYREPFGGAAAVLLSLLKEDPWTERRIKCKKYWLNDYQKDLVNFWEHAAVGFYCERMVERLLELEALPTIEKKKLFKHYQENFDGFGFATSQQMAMQYFFLNRCSFSGTTFQGGFSKSAAEDRFTINSIKKLRQLPDLLRNVKITCSDFEPVIKAEGEGVFLFIDAPYVTAKSLYGRKDEKHLHNEFDHERLAKVLKETKHKWLATYDDCSKVRDLYKDFEIRDNSMRYSMSKEKTKNELIITNF